MNIWIALSGVGIAIFVATDIDDLFILVAFFADKTFKTKNIITGQFLGIIFMLLASSLSYFFKLFIPVQWIGLMGLLPVALGVKEAFEAKDDWEEAGKAEERYKSIVAGNDDDDGDNEEIDIEKVKRGKLFKVSQVLSVAAVTIANGGDNIGVYIPLFATSSAFQTIIYMAVFLVMTGVWLAMAYYIVNNKLVGHHVKKYGGFVLPFVLIILGIYIMIRCETFSLISLLY